MIKGNSGGIVYGPCYRTVRFFAVLGGFKCSRD